MTVNSSNIELYKYYQEWWKAGISALTPITIAFLTYFITTSINERESFLRRGEQISADKQKIYALMGPCLNTIFIYVVDYGDYANYTPDQVLSKKRDSDRYFFVYRPYWSDQTVKLYQDFMNAAFSTFSGYATDAKIRSLSDQKREALSRRGIEWQPKWNQLFTGEVDQRITDKYYSLTASVLEDAATATIHTSNPLKKETR